MPDRIDSGIPSPAEMASAERTAITGKTTDLTGGPGLERVREGAVQVQHQRLREADKQFDLGTRLSAALQETPTAYITRGVIERHSDPAMQDFDPELDHYSSAREIMDAYGIPDSAQALEVLAEAGTREEQERLAARLQEHDFRQQVLSRHGGLAFTTQMLDPTYLIADFATFGATRALRVGRGTSAAMGASAFTGVTATADAAGMETSTFDYVLGAALTGGAFGLFGGEAAARIRSGEGNWFGQPNVDGKMQRLNEFLSDTDTLIARTPETAPFVRMLVDDPVRRAPYTANNNAAALKRRHDNELDGYAFEYDRAVEQHLKTAGGFRNPFTRKLDLGGKYTEAKNAFNREVASELLARNQQYVQDGFVAANRQVPDPVKKAADVYEQMMNRAGRLAQDSGLPGFEDFTAQPGYFHRSWNGSKIRAVGEDNARALVKASAVAGIRGISDADAEVIARAVVDRALAKRNGESLDLLGSLGRADTDALQELLAAGGLSDSALESAMRRIEGHLSSQGTVKYAKSRLPLDMTARTRMADGTEISVMDLIDTDLDRVARNYNGAMSGRAALAKAGVGRTDAEISAFRKRYLDTLGHLPDNEFNRARDMFDSIVGDFTGRIPDRNRLTPLQQTTSALATGVMLTASGMWQVAEYATMAHRFGAATTAKEFFKQFPGVRQSLRSMNGNKDLADELSTVLNLDLARDVRFRPWMQQHDDFLAASNTWLDRVAHFGKQAIPFVNGMKYIHSHQSRMNLNLATNKLARALAGDQDAIRMIRQYAPDLDLDDLGSRVRSRIDYTGRNADEMNWGAWAPEDADAAANVILRMADDSILFGRVGQGSAFSRTAVGQILGQFRSFVSFAHNKLLRGTLHNGGERGGELALAALMVHQYPITVLAVMANDARQGRLDITEDGAIEDTMRRAVGYTAGLGFFADAAGIVGETSGRGGVSVPVMGLTTAPAYAWSGVKRAAFDGEFQRGAGDISKAAATALPIINGLPGSAAAIDAMRSE